MFTHPAQFEPLQPDFQHRKLDELRERCATLVERAQRLAGMAHPVTRTELRELLRAMNSYYSNRIEGQGTHPLNIQRALARDFSERPDVARLQRIAVAHLDAERELEARVAAGDSPTTMAFLIDAHRALYSRLAPQDRLTDDGLPIEPGALRNREVEVGRHVPPAAAALPAFLARLDQVFGKLPPGERLLLPVACLHQRAAWVHPFLDGNGRALRLQTHAALWRLSDGLWSVNRGLARRRADYYDHLAAADAARRGDLDGRGNLSEAALRDWCDFFLGICEDQVGFMTRLLDLDAMKTRMQALLSFRAAHDKNIRMEALAPLHYVFAAGPVTRGEFAQMTGLKERTARALLSRLLTTGLLRSDTPLGPVRLGLPLDALQFLLPDLYPEAATQPD
ncbi:MULTISPECIES: Fic family protein [Derxia]|uniref:Fic family protein n=1 Tax=Derxia gummosa DSM 723 TaxID=1121388 RepID=A0A8B6X2H8_9BURK|nr:MULTISPECIES: Fic family protein [Derxia]